MSQSKLRIAMAGGGTGGHVLPSLSMLEQLRELRPEVEVLYLGTAEGAERGLVEGGGIRFQAIAAGRLRERGPLELLKNLAMLARGVVQSVRALRAFRPDCVFATGGFASVPAGLAARLLRLPLVVFLPDVAPGWAVKVESRLASRIATTSDAALEALPRGKTEVTGYPVRGEFWSLDREAGRSRLGLGKEGKVLLVSGASTGSVALNTAVIESAHTLLDECEIVHLTGPLEEARVAGAAQALPGPLGKRWRVYGYLADMPAAMHAADLAVMRSGASVLGELPAAGLPAVLVPYPHAGGHQRLNAAFLERRGAARMLPESRLDELVPLVRNLMKDEEELVAMRARLAELRRPDAAAALARLVLEAAA